MSMATLVVDSNDYDECARILNAICSATGILCYDPDNDVDP